MNWEFHQGLITGYKIGMHCTACFGLCCLILALGCLSGLSAFAQRAPVLGHIDLPHPYYYREMYLPQLTGGPSSVTWLPDGQALAFSMAGSLWRQPPNSDVAERARFFVAMAE